MSKVGEWEVIYLPDAAKDLRNLDGSQRVVAAKAIERVRANPLPTTEGGYGKPLGNKGGNHLTGLLKVKLKGQNLRVVYRLEKLEGEMLIIVIAARADEEVYDTAAQRYKEYLRSKEEKKC